MSHKALPDLHSTLSVTPAHLLLQAHLYASPRCLLHSRKTEPVLVPLLSLACRLYTWYSSSRTPLFFPHLHLDNFYSFSDLNFALLISGQTLLSTLTELGVLLPVCSHNLL